MLKWLACIVIWTGTAIASCTIVLNAQNSSIPNDITLEGLKGNVKRVDEERATVITKNGLPKEIDRRRTRSMAFDKQGRIVYEWIAIADLSPFEHHYDYDKTGKQFRRTSRQGQTQGMESVQSLKTYRFDPSSRVLFVDEYRGDRVDSDALRQKYEYHFDENGLLSERITKDSKNKQVFRTAYTYDPQQIIHEERLSMAQDPVGQIFVYENTSDSHGNWIHRRSEMTILKSGEKRVETVFRKISYR